MQIKSKLQGFTLVELLVTISIAAILATIAIPNYQQFILNTRMTTQANEFLTMLNFTRSESIKRNARVTMCKSNNGQNCAITALTESTANWQSGWIVFTDSTTAGIIDGTDTILRVHGALTTGSTLTGNSSLINYVSYMSNGRTQLTNGGMQGGTFSLCSLDQSLPRRKIIITQSTGKARIEKAAPSATCTS